MLSLMNHLTASRNRHVLFFDTESELNAFSAKLNSSRDVVLRKAFTNYSKFAIELTALNLESLTRLRSNLGDELKKYAACSVFLSHGVNADSYLYEFEQLAQKLNTDKNPDIEFLLSKVNMDEFKVKIKNSIEIVEQALATYDTNQLCVSFNGGKDCCVVLYLFYAVCVRMGARLPLNVLLIKIQHQFAEMNFFLEHVASQFYGQKNKFFQNFTKNVHKKFGLMKKKNAAL